MIAPQKHKNEIRLQSNVERTEMHKKTVYVVSNHGCIEKIFSAQGVEPICL